jgi:hypothetical protein
MVSQAEPPEREGLSSIIYHYISLAFQIWISFNHLASISFYRPPLIVLPTPYPGFTDPPSLPFVFVFLLMTYFVPLRPLVSSYELM